jgi:drug/metabolite transporter superfamily protein YnfA
VVDVIRSLARFFVAALAEIGGVWLVWHGWREHLGWCGSVNRDIARLQDQLGIQRLVRTRRVALTPRASDSYPRH